MNGEKLDEVEHFYYLEDVLACDVEVEWTVRVAEA